MVLVDEDATNGASKAKNYDLEDTTQESASQSEGANDVHPKESEPESEPTTSGASGPVDCSDESSPEMNAAPEESINNEEAAQSDGDGRHPSGTEQTEERDDVPQSATPKESSSMQRLRTGTGRMPRQWLVDRCDGREQSDPDSRPPYRACWPPIPLKWYPDMLEQNCLCETVGRIGCVNPNNDRTRKALLWVCLVCNIVGFLFLILASFGIARNSFGILWHFSFTDVWLSATQNSTEYDIPFEFAIGLRAAAFRLSSLGGEDKIVPFDELCDGQHDAEHFLNLVVGVMSRGDADCSSCRDTSHKIVPSLFLSMLGYIPNFTTDVLRMYKNYDVNCQKFFASIFSWVSFSTAIYTWANYRRNCFDYLNYSPIYISDNLVPLQTEDGDSDVVFYFKYGSGLGEVCLALASLLKVVDIICNIALPTPSITRNHAEQVDYEVRFGSRAQDEEEVAGGSVSASGEKDEAHEQEFAPGVSSVRYESEGKEST